MNAAPPDTSSILILADGRILARNVTPAIAAILLSLQPDNAELAARVSAVPTPTPTP